MSFNSDGLLDIDEVLRIAELSINPEMGMDMFMVVESGGAPVEGESTRAFGDGKPPEAPVSATLLPAGIVSRAPSSTTSDRP